MDKPLIRFTLSLPINENTRFYFDEWLSLIKDNFGGCTFSRFHLPCLKMNSKKIKGYFIGKYEGCDDEEICFIIFDVDPIIFQNVYDDISKLIRKILDTDEKVVWLTYHDILLCK